MSTLSLPAISIRTCVALVGAISALFAPWWVPLICMVFLAVRYPAWEVLVIALLIDLTWTPGDGLWVPFFTLGAICTVWILAPLRSQLFFQ